MARSEHHARLRRPLIAVALAVMIVLGACTPPMTMNQYAAGDGARANLGSQVKVENLLVITEAEGSAGTLVGGVVNLWEQEAEVSLSVQDMGEAVTVTVDPAATLLLHPEHESVVLPAVPVAPGATLEVQISTDNSGSITVPVPVLDGTLDPYQDYLPEG
ncbi:hypothetical protein ACO0LV_04565 [Pseudactinotalea sp. Z1739]|uniref:hypothetical protein n=1 Tax=Pseudactinotalea sp. Z1739 TaxID=3413028 RepID=UPI003C7C6D88